MHKLGLLNIKFIFLAFLCYSSITFSKVLIFTYAYNQPEFIELQYKTFKKFLKDDYEIIVFNDAKDTLLFNKIHKTCNKYKLKCIDIPQEIHDRPYLNRNVKGRFSKYHNVSVRNCNVVQYSLDNYGFKHDDIVALVDSDIFLTANFSIKEYMKNYDIAAWNKPCSDMHTCKRRHPGLDTIEYLWIGLVFLNMKTLPNKETLNFNCGNINKKISVNSGGYTYYYLQQNPDVKCKFFDRIRFYDLLCSKCKSKTNPYIICDHNIKLLKNYKFDLNTINFIQNCPFYTEKKQANTEFYLENKFIHYRGGSCHHKLSKKFYDKKTKLLNSFILTALS